MFTYLKRFFTKLLFLVSVLTLIGAALPQATAYAASDFSDASIVIKKVGNRITVTAEKLQKSSTYFVKLDDASKKGLLYYKVGKLKTDKNKEGEGTYDLPGALDNTTSFNVCLKNVTTNDLICSDKNQTRIVSEDDDSNGSSSGSSKKGTFTVTRTATSVVINTSNFPHDTTYNVKVTTIGAKEPTWYKIGVLKTKDDSSGRYTFKMASQLNNEDNLRVCLKNTKNDDLKCVEIRR